MGYSGKLKRISSFQLIIAGFLAVILVGSLLLMLPCATVDKGGASFIDALFTATSSVCVTGLIVQDTATYWSAFGQTLIILMIQIGGLGVVTVALCISRYAGLKIGLRQRSTMQEAVSAPTLGGIVRLTAFIFKITITIELIGAALLFPVFRSDFGAVKGLGYSLFHSISAFCNAGFDLMAGTGAQSLTGYSVNIWVNIIIMLLIVIGGLGFVTWYDIKTNKFRFKKYRVQSKIIIVVSATLIIFPALYFFFYEFSKPAWGELSIGGRALAAVFQSVTTRTAGFNSVNLTNISEPGIIIMIVLMLIGGSPGSTAGGFKTTTAAVLVASAAAVFRRRQDAHVFGRRISDETVRNAAAIILLYISLMLTGAAIISCVEGLPMVTCMFETASAIGTVGLTLGVTSGLSVISRIILILLMFFGRVGGLTLIYAALSEKKISAVKYPQEKITVG